MRNATSHKRRHRGKSRRAKDVAKKAHIALVRGDASASEMPVAQAQPVREETERSECRRIDPQRAILEVEAVDREVIDLDVDLTSSFFQSGSNPWPVFAQEAHDERPLLTAEHLQRRVWLRQQVFRLMCGLLAFTVLALLVHWVGAG